MPGDGKSWKPSHSPWLIAVAVMLATFMEVMDTSIASVAVPYIAGSTASTNDEAEWVLTVYLVANAVFLPTSNYLAQKFGRKRFLIASIGIFTFASFLCGIAPSLGFILGARIIQGIGGGALQPLSQAILIESFPEEQQGLALGVYALGVVLAPVIGPAFGGYLTDAISWRWAFYINIPVGIAAMLMQAKVLEDPPQFKNANPGKLDGVGLGLLGLWIGCLQYVLDKGQENDWFGEPLICWATGVCVVGFFVFIAWEYLHPKPLVDLRAFKNRNLAVGCLLVFLLGAVLYGLTTVLPNFFQTLMGYDATAAGLAVSPRGLGSILSSVAVGILVSKMDPRWIVAAGFATLGLSSLWLSMLTLDISPTTLFWPILVSGLGLAMIFVPLSKVALGTLPPSEEGNASGIFNFLRNVGGSVGISAANTFAQRHSQMYRNQLNHWYSGSSWLLRRQLSALARTLGPHADMHGTTQRALLLTNSTFNNQAQLRAYVDVLRYFAILGFVCMPLSFLLKKPKPGAGGAA